MSEWQKDRMEPLLAALERPLMNRWFFYSSAAPVGRRESAFLYFFRGPFVCFSGQPNLPRQIIYPAKLIRLSESRRRIHIRKLFLFLAGYYTCLSVLFVPFRVFRGHPPFAEGK